MKNDFICDKCGKCFSRKNWFDKHFLLGNEKLARPSMLDYEIEEIVSDFNDNNDNSHEDLETDIDDRDDIDIDLDFSVDCGTSSPMVLSSDTVVVADLDGISNEGLVDDVSDDINATDDIEAHREYERKRKDIQRKKDNLRNLLKKIDTMNCTEKETVLVKRFNESNMSFPYETMKAELGRCLLRYLKTLDCRSVKDGNQYCVILHNVYGEKNFTTDITTWLTKCLDTRPCCIKSMMQFWLDIY